VATLDQAPRDSRPRPPGLAWRVLSPIGAVLVAFVVLIVTAGVLFATDLSDESIGAIASFGTSLLLLVFAVLLWRRLPEHNRRWAVEPKRSLGAALGLGIPVGLGIVVGAGAIIVAGSALDPVVERRLEEVDDIGTAPWQLVLTILALVVLAPLGEELLFRGLLLRALARRFRFWPAAIITSVLFTAAHADAYLLWPRAIALVGTGLLLAWVYRQRGYWASVAAHATVNTIASIALVASS
jgi:membrane protease YdiL (CAAX protease family)